MRMKDANVMVSDFIRKNMWDSGHRPEQLFTRNFLAQLQPTWKIKSEYRISNLTIDGAKARMCVLDIAVPQHKIAIRLNGGYHFSSDKQIGKDEFQREALEQAGWRVIDLDHHMMPNLFKKKKSNETVKLAEEELIKYINCILNK